MEQDLDDKIKNALKESQSEMLGQLSHLIDRKLSHSASLDSTKFQSTKESFKFKKPHHEEQHKSNEKVLDKLYQTQMTLQSVDDNLAVSAASTTLKEGIDLLLHRQKLIKLADSSELGWKVVAEYESHHLASDSEDEKRIYKAEARANKKVLNERKKKNSRFHPFRRESVTANSSSASSSSRKPGLCFRCSLPGHWKNECPRKAEDFRIQAANKISILNKTEPWGFMGLTGNICGTQSKECVQSSLAGMIARTKSSTSTHIIASKASQVQTPVVLQNADALSCNKPTVCVSSVDDSSSANTGFTDRELHTINGNLNGDMGVHCSAIFTRKAIPSDRVVFHDSVSPRGRLKEHSFMWEQAGASDYMMSIVQYGYKLPFLTVPKSCLLKNNQSARANPVFVEEELEKLLSLNCISKVTERPTVVNPLTVAQNREGKTRLVLDCRHINEHLAKFKFRLEDSSVARELFTHGDFLFTFDLRSAYHILEIFPSYRTYLGFSWRFKGIDTYFVFNVLPFGVSTAAYIFTKLTRVVTRFWRGAGIRVLMYLDDGMAGDKGQGNASKLSERIEADLISFGFLISYKKCVWYPTQLIRWLGLHWDMSSGRVSVCEDRVSKLLASIDGVDKQVARRGGVVNARALAAVIGQLISRMVPWSLVFVYGVVICIKL